MLSRPERATPHEGKSDGSIRIYQIPTVCEQPTRSLAGSLRARLLRSFYEVVQSLITLKNRQVGLSPGKKAFHHGWQV